MQSTANGTEALLEWNAVDWREANRVVRNLRRRIFKAEREGKHHKVRDLQKLLLRSLSNTLLSVRQVTQVNQGRNTAGVDKVVIKTPEARMGLVRSVSEAQPWRVHPTRRVYIPKGNGKKRPLGIPTVMDRVLQARVKSALEPQWEARFEASSYGFRAGRGCHDAITAVFHNTNARSRRQWIIDADIEGAFDHIDHAFLLRAISEFPARELVKQWLKAGFVEAGVRRDTPAGTPQGGVISPLLANIALHGMEAAVGVDRYASGHHRRTGHSRAVVRFADDFVVFCESKEDALKVMAVLREWLADRGLSLSAEKTRIVHITQGFDFLGFNVRQYLDRTTRSGRKLLIKPSKKSVQRYREKLRAAWKSLAGCNASTVIRRLTPIIRGWANYFRVGVCKYTFGALDTWMFKKAWRWAKRTHPGKSALWRKQRYFRSWNPRRNNRWVFGDESSGKYLPKFTWTKVKRHTKVVGTSSPDDPELRDYWARRRGQHTREVLLPQWHAPAARQSHICPVCSETLANGERLELHHEVLDRLSSERHRPTNQKVVHYYCHQQIHSGMRANTPASARKLIREA